jgi:2,4-dienoyl-CoA reductase-like NADH-dependent reductase (Old Yellow Enzyme family)
MSPFESLTLPNGTVVPNRIAKAAMEEHMADAEHLPSAELLRLYQAWADGGVGLIITGNVMIDRRAMTGPGGVVLEDGVGLEAFRNWARTGRARGAQMWLQLNHPGRQMMKNLGQETRAPSAVSLDLGKHSKLFATPRAMTEQDIHEVITRFKRGEAGRASGLLRRPDSRGAWLSDQPVPVAADEPAHRPLGRVAGEPGPHFDRRRQSRPCGRVAGLFGCGQAELG